MIDEREVAQLLRAATDDVAVPATPERDLVAAGTSRRRRRRVVAGLAATGAVVAVAAVVPVALSAERSGRSDTPVGSTDPAGASCVEPVPTRVLPGWARSGFTDPEPRMPYVTGADGDIVAILFAQPLTSPAPTDHNNKILWVSRAEGSGDLHITATLPDGSPPVTRVVDGGPGPSIIDLPRTGCWHLVLTWGDSSDSLDLSYVAP